MLTDREATHLKAVHLAQRSNEWQSTRKRFAITGSEFATAIGIGYESRKNLWKLKKGKIERKENRYTEKIMQWGVVNEQNALQKVAEKLNVPVNETGLWPINDKLASSPDGIIWTYDYFIPSSKVVTIVKNNVNVETRKTVTGETMAVSIKDIDIETIWNRTPIVEAVVEVKCPYPKNGRATPYLCLKDGKLPASHYVQVQGHIKATECVYGIYCCWTPDESIICKVKRNDEAWDFIEKHLNDFIICLENDIEPKRTIDRNGIVRKINDFQEEDVTLL